MNDLTDRVEAAIRRGAPQAEAEALARELAPQTGSLLTVVPSLVDAPGAVAGAFAYALGRETPDPAALLAAAKPYLSADGTPPGGPFVGSLLLGWHETRPEEAAGFFDAALTDPLWSRHYAALQTRIGFGSGGHARLLRALRESPAPAGDYRALADAHRLAQLDVPDVEALVSALADRPDGLAVAVAVLAEAIPHEAGPRRSAVADAVARFLARADWLELLDVRPQDDETFDRILAIAAAEAGDASLTGALAGLIAGERRAGIVHSPDRRQWLAPFLRHRPALTLAAMAAPGPHRTGRMTLAMLAPFVPGHALTDAETRRGAVLAWLGTLAASGDDALNAASARLHAFLRDAPLDGSDEPDEEI